MSNASNAKRDLRVHGQPQFHSFRMELVLPVPHSQMEGLMASFLRIERDGALASIIFAREKGLNIISSALIAELGEAWSDVEKSGARVCVIRGEGKAFLAGADIKEMAQLDPAGARQFAAKGQALFDRIESSPVVSIAAIHGACLGG